MDVAGNSAIEQLTELALARHLLDDRIAGKVAEARRTGATWAQIGGALRMDRSNAHRKYARTREAAEDDHEEQE
jgi:hypothetical protein